MRGRFGEVLAPSLSELGQLRSEVHAKFQRHENETGVFPPGRNAFYGATDALWDTHDALLSLERGFPQGAAKLSVYGLLQALFIQQDAVVMIDVLTRIGDPDKFPNDLHEGPLFGPIRVLRNRVAGHPVYAKLCDGTAAIPLVRSPYHLEAAIYGLKEGNEGERFPRFHIGELIEQNAEGLLPILAQANGLLNEPKEIFDRLVEVGHLKASKSSKPNTP
jgi:hypothetical protein